MFFFAAALLLVVPLGSALADGDDVLCFSRNDSTKLTTFIDLVEGAVREKCGDRYNDTKGNATLEPIVEHPKPEPRLLDCSDLRGSNKSSGIYTIWPQGRVLATNISVYCDMEDDGGGWTVIQRRGEYGNPTGYFNLEWDEYKVGFGNLTEDFWLGNDIIFTLTNQRPNAIKFELRDWEGNSTYAYYDFFYIEDEFRSYTLHVEGYEGTAGDSFGKHSQYPFSTKDRDQSNNKCPISHRGAWWYFRSPNCETSNLNGQYWRGKVSIRGGVSWATFRGYQYSLKETVIKIRPRFPPPLDEGTTSTTSDYYSISTTTTYTPSTIAITSTTPTYTPSTIAITSTASTIPPMNDTDKTQMERLG